MLSIIIINFKNPPLLRLSLKSLISSIASNFNYELLVVDIASTPETKNIVDEFPKARLLSLKENIGFTKGLNYGLKNANGNYFLILNPDVIPLKGAIEKLYEFIKTDSKIALAGPKLLNFDGTRQASCFRFPTPLTIIYRRTYLGHLPIADKYLKKFTMADKDLSGATEVNWLMGSAMIINKKAVEKTGLMDERFFLYMSDIDWPRRFWENGYKVVYFPESIMYHYHKRDSKGKFGVLDFIFKRESRWHISDAIKYFLKYGIL